MPAPTNQFIEVFQHYQVLRRDDGALWELGRGAMGVTYKAFDTNLRSHVALKVIDAMHLEGETARNRFLREARAAAGLRHRNVASVYHLGNDDDCFFYAMEFIDGETIESLVKRCGPLPPVQAIDIALQVARALGAAHRQGLVHRDIKPANLMVVEEDEDEQAIVKVIDFGLARSTTYGSGSAHITISGFVGTPQYASPEQVQEQELDTRSDIYSLGITLWYLLVGHPPFVGALGNVFLQHLTKEPPWEQLGPLVDGPLQALLARMLAKDPTQRPQTPLELRRELEGCLRALARTSAEQDSRAPVRPLAGGDALPPLKTAAPATEAPAKHVEMTAPQPGDTAPPVVGHGTVLTDRYEVECLVGEGNTGRIFRARDRAQNGRPVAVKLLHSGLLGEPEIFQTFQDDLLRVRAAPHPGLLSYDELACQDGHAFLVQEWVDGFTLVDLLCARGRLSARETLCLLDAAAAAVDYAYAHGLERLQFAPHQILASLLSGTTADASGTKSDATRTVLALAIERWPAFQLKLDPLGIAAESGNCMIWSGDRTVLPSQRSGEARTPSRDTQSAMQKPFSSTYLPDFAALGYELLSGTPPPAVKGEKSAMQNLAPVPSLGEEGNNLLRRVLSGEGSGFSSAHAFCLALARACRVPLPARTGTQARTSTPTATPLPAQPKPGPATALQNPTSPRDSNNRQIISPEDEDSIQTAILGQVVLPPQTDAVASPVEEKASPREGGSAPAPSTVPPASAPPAADSEPMSARLVEDPDVHAADRSESPEPPQARDLPIAETGLREGAVAAGQVKAGTAASQTFPVKPPHGLETEVVAAADPLPAVRAPSIVEVSTAGSERPTDGLKSRPERRKTPFLPVPALAIAGGVAVIGLPILIYSLFGHGSSAPKMETHPAPVELASPATSDRPAIPQASFAPSSQVPPQPSPESAQTTPPPPVAAAQTDAAPPRGGEEKSLTPPPAPTVSGRPSMFDNPAPSPEVRQSPLPVLVQDTPSATLPSASPKENHSPTSTTNSRTAGGGGTKTNDPEEANKKKERVKHDPAVRPSPSAPSSTAPRETSPPKAAEKPKPQPTPEDRQQRGPVVPFLR